MTIKPILAFAPLMLLAACGDDEPTGETPVEQGGEAAGEVLGGTISDDMIALDRLTSASPLAERSASNDTEGGGASEPADDPDPEPEPASELQATEAAPPAAPVSTPTVATPLE